MRQAQKKKEEMMAINPQFANKPHLIIMENVY